VRELVYQRHQHDVVVAAHEEGIEPLLGVYSKNCIKPLEESLFNGDLSLKDFLAGLNSSTYQIGDRAGEAAAGTMETSLPAYFNVNTPQDYSRLITRGSANQVSQINLRKHNS
jgi:molybdopterin-guanine dinucleotide biosynthesis protein A